MSTIITQVKRPKQTHQRVHIPETLRLNLRGTRIDVDRNTLVGSITILETEKISNTMFIFFFLKKSARCQRQC